MLTYLHSLNQRGPTTDGICAARETILHKSCRLQAAATFFFEERYDFGTKIGTSEIDSNRRPFFFF